MKAHRHHGCKQGQELFKSWVSLEQHELNWMSPTLVARISISWCVYVHIQTILGASTAGITLYTSQWNKNERIDAEYTCHNLRPIDPWMQKFGYWVESRTLPPVASDTRVLLSGSGARKRKSPTGGSAYGIPRYYSICIRTIAEILCIASIDNVSLSWADNEQATTKVITSEDS